MKTFISILIFLGVFTLNNYSTHAQTPDWLWAVQAGGTNTTTFGSAIATDGLGNSIVTGNFSGTATFGNTTLTSAGGATFDIFIAKYDGDGNFLWVEQAGGTDSDMGLGIATDGSGNTIVTGRFSGTATFGNTILTSAGVEDMFIAKYDGDGSLLWVEQAVGTNITLGRAIATDGSGNSIVTGSFGGTATFGNTTLTSAGFRDIFIAKYDGDGNFLWVEQAGGTDFFDDGFAIATDGSGNTIVTGWFQGSVAFGDTTLTSAGSVDIFIAKLGLVTGIEEEFALPRSFNLSQNYPNPFNPSTNIQYAISSRQIVTLRVYDVLGNQVATLVNEEKAAGNYEINFNASNLSSGIYFYKLQTSDFTQIKKMILLK